MYTVLKRTIYNVYCIETYFVRCIPHWDTFQQWTYWKTSEFTRLQVLCIVSYTIKLLN